LWLLREVAVHETLRKRILRRLEALPEAKLYQALDYIEFLESQYARAAPAEGASGLQRLAERLEDGLRKRTLSPASLREAFQLIAAADRVLATVTEAGKDILFGLQGSEPRAAGVDSPSAATPPQGTTLPAATRPEPKEIIPG
jgi:hypothetical protein